MIKVENLTKRFGQVTAVDGVSFEVEAGEIVGFLGPNGAGKTTTMRIITGFIPATSGKISIAGHDVFDEPLECKRRIGYLPESIPVYGEMDVTSYLRFVHAIKGLPKGERDRDIERVLHLADIADRRNRTIGHLSKGLKKRVGLAQALLGNPDVLILDEPTEGLDPNQLVAIRELIRSLARSHTVVLSTHILSEVEATCSRALIIDRGRLIASDSVEHLREARPDRVNLTVRVRGSEELAQRALAEVAVVSSVRTHRLGEETVIELAVPERQHAADVAAALVRAGLGLVELGSERARLEDTFVRLTRRDAVTGDGMP
jgi:ABC-2 type transport system ATP-binding protein